MNKKLVVNPNMETTSMLQFIKPPETFDIEGDSEKFIEECEKFFELTQTAEEHRGIFIRVFFSVEATRKYEEGGIDGENMVSYFVHNKQTI